MCRIVYIYIYIGLYWPYYIVSVCLTDWILTGARHFGCFEANIQWRFEKSPDSRSLRCWYPLVNQQKAMENGHLW